MRSLIDTPNKTQDAWEGIRDGLRFFPFYLPLALTYAVTAKVAGIAPWEVVLWSAVAYAGTAQLACISAWSGGARLVELLLITFMANSRHTFIAISLAPYFGKMKRKVLPILALTVSTTSLALLPMKVSRGGDLQTYAVALQVCQWAQWVGFTVVGVLLGPIIPASWTPVIGFAAPAAFLALLIPLVRENLRSGLVVALIAAAAGVGLTVVWPPQVCAIVGALAGGVAALFLPEARKANA